VQKKILNSLFIFFISSLIFYKTGICFNTTPSVPLGLYWKTQDPLKKGSYVIFCPLLTQPFSIAKQRNYITSGLFCPNKYGYLIKQIVALKGDSIAVTNTGVFINGHLHIQSKPLRFDLIGKKLPYYRITNFILKENDCFLMSKNDPLSFDSRYFGVIPLSQIQTVIRPIFTWE
jgi:conjugative transfer signal peptidase TraF